ncbi:hypothetical protein GCM10010977_10170 [Citricoccus zhacaiensis]|uniref:Uncharacterized protein n=1 Tax=Citricoccus zhacaiensis TaxID=489142 RepID=A0ABQ2LTI6_9MICC|nr:hypothetical protein GCM10010977_10170 [Citricoccus zhacaiensis]
MAVIRGLSYPQALSTVWMNHTHVVHTVDTPVDSKTPGQSMNDKESGDCGKLGRFVDALWQVFHNCEGGGNIGS